MSNIITLHKKGLITVEKRVVQDLFIQWNGKVPIPKKQWAKMLAVGMKYIIEWRDPKDTLYIRKNENAFNYMVSCSKWT